MTDIIPRSHPRTTCQVPIQYALLNSEQFEATRTYDYSPEGLCYEVHQKLAPEAEVCIVMQNYAPGLEGPESYRSYVARICWIHLLSKNGSERYAAGAQIVARSHEVLATEEQIPKLTCDMCGQLAPAHKLHQSETGVSLCHQCLKHYCNIPSEKIRTCVSRFLMGNVV